MIETPLYKDQQLYSTSFRGEYASIEHITENFLSICSPKPLSADTLEELLELNWINYITPIMSVSSYVYYTFKKIHNETNT